MTITRRALFGAFLALIMYSHIHFDAYPGGRPSRTATRIMDNTEEFSMAIAKTTYRVGFDEYEATEFSSSYFANSGWRRDIIFSRGKNWDPGACARL